LVAPPELRRQGLATRLVQALIAEYPGKVWVVPPIWPEESVRGLFEKLGFSQEALTQLQMMLVLS
jgi:hypothetical protein